MASRKIGILIGNFDPIHYGHLLLGEAAREQYGLDRVIFIPEKLAHLMKGNNLSSGDIRYNMVKLAIKDNPYFTCSRIEIDKPKGTYTYDVFQELRSMYPGDELYLILGGDAFVDIETWYNAKELLQSCTILAAVRDNHDVAALDNVRRKLLKQYDVDIQLLTFNRIDISSQDIRKRVRTGRSIKYMVPKECIEFICLKGLYK